MLREIKRKINNILDELFLNFSLLIILILALVYYQFLNRENEEDDNIKINGKKMGKQ